MVFELDSNEYAVDLTSVERVVQAMELTPIPEAPTIVAGMVSLQGDLMPILDIRKHLGLPIRELKPDDLIVIVNTARRRLGFIIDSIIGVREGKAQAAVETREIVPRVHCVTRAMQFDENIVMLLDPETFLSTDEHQVMDDVCK